MSSTIAGLIALQRLDDDVYRIKRRLADGPRLVERRGERLREAEQQLEKERAGLKTTKAAVAELELDLRSKEETVTKTLNQQNSAKTNQEYRALGEYAEKLRGECSQLEDQILERYSALEEAEAELRKTEAQVGELRQEAGEFQAQWERDRDEYGEELTRIEQRRATLCKELDAGPLKVYERILAARDGGAVVPVEGRRVCSGCRMTLTPNDVARLRGGTELVTCQSCERILYIPEVHDRPATA